MTAIALSCILLLTPNALNTEPRGKDMVLLDEYGPCGLTSLFIICKLRQVPVEWEQINQLLGPGGPDSSHSFADLSRAATALNMHAVALKANRAALHHLPMPAIVQVHDARHPEEPPHLLVLLHPESDGVMVLDPPYSAYFLPESRFAFSWTGNILVFTQDEQEAARIRAAAFGQQAIRRGFWGWLAGGVAIGLFVSRQHWIPLVTRVLSYTQCRVVSITSGRARRVVIALVCLTLLGVAAYAGWSNGRGKPPRCVAERPLHELGELTPGEGRYQVALKNEGETRLDIARVTSTCACAGVDAPQHIEPGETALLELKLNIAPGPQTARLTVESNDPEGSKNILVTWHGKGEPKLVPFRINDQSVRAEVAYERTVKLVYPGGRAARVPKLQNWNCDSDLVELRMGKNDPMAMRLAVSGLMTRILGEQELYVAVRPPKIPGPVTCTCKLVFKYGESPVELRLPISVRFIPPDLTPEADAIVLSAGHKGDLVGQLREVRIFSDNTARDVVVENAPDWLAYQVARAETGWILQLKVTREPDVALVQHTLRISRPGDRDTWSPLRVSVFAPQP